MNQDEPIFKPVFAKAWEQLPPVMRKHYANRPFSQDVVTAQGKMEVGSTGLFRLLSPVFRALNMLVPYSGSDIPVTVRYLSDEHSRAFYLDRIFYFPGKTPWHFRSCMLPVKDEVVTEFTAWGLGWRFRYLYDGHKITLNHLGYVWKVFGMVLPLPLTVFLGRVYAEEFAVSDESFRMKMEMVHPLFGKYFYAGEFKIMEPVN
ncbi:hypothetical protein AQUSIP_19280 [Aquicella siphonis]|uniref:DUF4166 domain-containing protein n=1 Tax=Aquicella siphonis TaxID=254247 RepID=A0A5E4PJ54_9COXI|nr:DUF4166 domain-containing protein [Aquicella siphonis]VVC76605.1 hypothetical protein AQUSIP_19280 [Aquicella siphonis]